MNQIEEIDQQISQLKKNLQVVKGTPTEVYTRIVGYFRAARGWNAGKKEEFKNRVTFSYDMGNNYEKRRKF